MIYSDYKRLQTIIQETPDIYKFKPEKAPHPETKHTIQLTPSLFLTITGLILGAITLIGYASLCVSAFFHAHNTEQQIIAINVFFIGIGLAWLFSRTPLIIQLIFPFLTFIILIIAIIHPHIHIPKETHEYIIILYIIYALSLAFSEFHTYRQKQKIWKIQTENSYEFSDSLTRIVPLIDKFPSDQVARKYHAENTTNSIIRQWHYKQKFYSFSSRKAPQDTPYIDEVLLAGKNIILIHSYTPTDLTNKDDINTPNDTEIHNAISYYKYLFPKYYVSAYCILYPLTKGHKDIELHSQYDNINYITPYQFDHIDKDLFFSYGKYVPTERTTIIKLLSLSRIHDPVRSQKAQQFFTQKRIFSNRKK